jgi:hypothetical protein
MHGHGPTVLVVKVFPIQESPALPWPYMLAIKEGSECLALAKFVSMMEENASEEEQYKDDGGGGTPSNYGGSVGGGVGGNGWG